MSSDNESIHNHSLAVFEVIGKLIDDGLRDSTIFDQILTDLVKKHRQFHEEDIKNLGNIIIEYVSKTLGRQKTTTMDTALIAFFNRTAAAFQVNDRCSQIDSSNNEKEISTVGEKLSGISIQIQSNQTEYLQDA